MSERQAIDRELNLRGIVYTGIGLAAILVAAAALMWPLSSGLRSLAACSDPPPPLLQEARERQLPPFPRLQEDPEAELAELRAREDAALASYGWVDESRGIALIPIERAMELVVEAAGGDPLGESR